jgi:hypothetical protein
VGLDDAFGNEFSVDHGSTDLFEVLSRMHADGCEPMLGRLVTGEFMAGA